MIAARSGISGFGMDLFFFNLVPWYLLSVFLLNSRCWYVCGFVRFYFFSTFGIVAMSKSRKQVPPDFHATIIIFLRRQLLLWQSAEM